MDTKLKDVIAMARVDLPDILHENRVVIIGPEDWRMVSMGNVPHLRFCAPAEEWDGTAGL